MRKYNKLTWENRKQIEAMRRAGAPARRIADALGVDRSTIYRELDRGRDGENRSGQPLYSAAVAQRNEEKNIAHRYEERRAAKHAEV